MSIYRHYLVLGSGLVCVLLLLSACAGNGEGLDEPDDETLIPPPQEAPAFSDIQTMIFIPICVCHVGAAAPLGLVLDTDDSINMLVNIPSARVPDLFRVEPGNPDDSYLVRKLEGGPDIVGSQMPLGGPPLAQDMIDRVREWIVAGALDN
ncbi:MAG: hypothetical protein OEU26_18905 [Candidatus Tectomicrobia bacterium]|nr:hypothetical protein [Candidatus Tectomicrobia bacterium]